MPRAGVPHGAVSVCSRAGPSATILILSPWLATFRLRAECGAEVCLQSWDLTGRTMSQALGQCCLPPSLSSAFRWRQ